MVGAPLRKPDIPSAGGPRCLAHHTRGRSCSPLGPDGGPRPAVVSPSAVMCPSVARRGCRPPSGDKSSCPGGGQQVEVGRSCTGVNHYSDPALEIRMHFEHWPGRRGHLTGPLLLLVQPGGRRVCCRPGLLVPAPTAGLLLSYGC